MRPCSSSARRGAPPGIEGSILAISAAEVGGRARTIDSVSTQVELPVLSPAPAAGTGSLSAERYAAFARRVKQLSWLSLGAMTIEGVVAIAAGLVAGSVALVGFGLDSAVE